MNRPRILTYLIRLAAMFASSGKSRRGQNKCALLSKDTMSMKNLSIVLTSAAILLTLIVAAQNGKAQSCPNPYFCSRTASADAEKCGFWAFTDPDANWDIHFYLRAECVNNISVDYNRANLGYPYTGTGSLSADIVYWVDATNSAEHWTNTSSVSESGVHSGAEYYLAYSITGTISSMDYWLEYPTLVGYDDFNWHTLLYTNGNLAGIHDAPLAYRDDDCNPDLRDFRWNPYTFPQPTITDTVYSQSQVINDDSDYPPYYKHYSLAETITLSVPYTDALLASVINAKCANFNAWTDPPTSLAASYSVSDDPNMLPLHITKGSGTRMQYRVAVPSSVKDQTYHFEWFEVTRDSSGRVLSKTKRTCSVVGTGDPANPALGDIFEVPVPPQPGATTVAEGLTPVVGSPRPPIPLPPHLPTPLPPHSPRLPMAGGGGR